jgi:3-oxoacyl-[acyl-carrier-protein] synthase III
MDGKQVYRFVVDRIPETIDKLIFNNGLSINEIDWLILHQANQRILNAVTDRLGIPSHKVISVLAEYGNTSAASIPLALDQGVRDHRIQPGDVIVAAGFGAGVSWGAAVFRWN